MEPKRLKVEVTVTITEDGHSWNNYAKGESTAEFVISSNMASHPEVDVAFLVNSARNEFEQELSAMKQDTEEA